MNNQLKSSIAAMVLALSPVIASADVPVAETEQVPHVQQHNKLILSWSEFDVLNKALAKKIYESGWEFDQIVCIARGGMFIGDPLSRIFEKPLAVISASSYRAEGGTQQAELIISDRLAMTTPTLRNRILLVDDLVDSGVTLRAVRAALLERYPNVQEIKTAVLWRKTGTTFEADFYVDEVDKDLWIVQPFEHFEDVRPELL